MLFAKREEPRLLRRLRRLAMTERTQSRKKFIPRNFSGKYIKSIKSCPVWDFILLLLIVDFVKNLKIITAEET